MHTIYSEGWKDYELVDGGNGRKLERWGTTYTIRPDRNAYFPMQLKEEEWNAKVDFEFIEDTPASGKWIKRKSDAEPEWEIKYGKAIFNIKLTKFKHVGLFPEQQTNWEFIQNKVQKDQRLLNLFGYTGAASVIAKLNHAEVYHCDSVKNVLTWGKENMEASGVEGIKWVLEDALKFAQREAKRGNKYRAVIMDPPAFGIGVALPTGGPLVMLPELLGNQDHELSNAIALYPSPAKEQVTLSNRSNTALETAMIYDLDLRKELQKPKFYFKLLFNR